MTETVLRENEDLITVFNVFEVPASKQHELVAVLNEGVDQFFRHRPGFVSVAILASTDGSRVINLAQWRTQDDLWATMSESASHEYAKKAAQLGTPALSTYSVVTIHTAS